MTKDIDKIFEEIRELSRELDNSGLARSTRDDLLSRRDQLRTVAIQIERSTRHPKSVEAEISMLEERLEEIRGMNVTKGYAEKHLTKGFADPGAYSAAINRLIEDEHEDEVSEIRARLIELNNYIPVNENE